MKTFKRWILTNCVESFSVSRSSFKNINQVVYLKNVMLGNFLLLVSITKFIEDNSVQKRQLSCRVVTIYNKRIKYFHEANFQNCRGLRGGWVNG
jgi:hypothetical protein